MQARRAAREQLLAELGGHAMPAARTATGSPSCAATRSTTSAGTSRPESSAIRLIWLRFVIGMMPGRIGMSTPAARPALDEPK